VAISLRRNGIHKVSGRLSIRLTRLHLIVPANVRDLDFFNAKSTLQNISATYVFFVTLSEYDRCIVVLHYLGEISKIGIHRVSDFKAKMHQI